MNLTPRLDALAKLGLVALGVSLVVIGASSLLISAPAHGVDGQTAPGIRLADAVVDAPATGEQPSGTAMPLPEDIPGNGTGENFELVGHAPLLDEHQYVDDVQGVPRGSNGEITVAGDCVYVGSFSGNQPPLIVDVADPTDPRVVGPVPDAVPGVGNGIEGIEASGGVLAIDHRAPHGDPLVEVPDGTPARGMSVWNISDDCREPELVARYDHGDLDVHSLRLWRDPANPDRLLAVESFIDTPNVRVLDLTGCPDPDACDPEVVAEWSLDNQTGLESTTHEAIMSTDGERVYVAQPMVGFLQLDSSNLIASLRGNGTCDPTPPEDVPGEGHCLTVLDPDVTSSLEAQSPIQDGWHHTFQKVPDRPYVLALSESSGPEGVDPAEPAHYGSCPGGTIRVFSVAGPDARADSAGQSAPNGTVHPAPVGSYRLPEQRPEHCGPAGWDPDEVTWPGWMSPHFTLPFPNVVFATYYSGGLRAIDISDPTAPVEVGHYLNKPVAEVRWATYGSPGAYEPYPFAFSYPVTHDGYVIYGDVNSGIYVLEYTGPHAEEVPDDGNCLPANPGGVEPGYEPCPPYGGVDAPVAEDVSTP